MTTLIKIKAMVSQGKFRLSEHGEYEMNEDGILLSELLQSLDAALPIEDYPDYWKGPAVLVLHNFESVRFHAMWGLSKAAPDVATLVTAYLPDPLHWSSDLKTRLKK